MYGDFELWTAHQNKSQRFMREAEQYRLARSVPKGTPSGGQRRGRLFRRRSARAGEVAAT